MTNIELETLSMIKSACREYISESNSKEKIRKNRKFELVKAIFPTLLQNNKYVYYEDAIKDAFEMANDILDKLEEEK